MYTGWGLIKTSGPNFRLIIEIPNPSFISSHISRTENEVWEIKKPITSNQPLASILRFLLPIICRVVCPYIK